MLKRMVLAAAVVSVVLVGLGTYYGWGWERMEQNCMMGNDSESYTLGFSVTEGGFVCKFSDGETRTSWWFNPAGPFAIQ